MIKLIAPVVAVSTEAYVTLATNDTYAIGALVLAASLKRVNSTRQRAILITPEVSSKMRQLRTDCGLA